VLQCLKTLVTSVVDQPITRNIYRNHSIYAKAKSTGLIYKPGFLFEDRQYQFTLQGLGAFCSTARHLNKHIGATATNLIGIEQELYSRDDYSLNPASLWNQMSKESLEKAPPIMQIEPILNYFDFNATLGLPIFYYNQLQRTEHLMSGYVIEINALTQDIDFYLSDKCVNLAWHIVNENIALLNESLARLKTRDSKAPPETRGYEFDLIPVDLLATAEKLNIHVFALNEAKIEPLLLVYILEPHTCLFIHNKAQKFEISFFDFNLREGAAVASKRKNDGILVPLKSDYSSFIIECKPGDPLPKTGILPSFFSFKLTNFLSIFQCSQLANEKPVGVSSMVSCKFCPKCYEIESAKSASGHEKRISSSVVFSRPVKIKIDENFLKKVSKFATENIDFVRSAPTEISENTKNPNTDFKYCFVDNLHIKTSQMMLVMPMSGCHDELQLSFSNIHVDTYGNEPDAIEIQPKLSPKMSHIYMKLKMSDVLCKLSHEMSQQMHLVGPFSFETRLKHTLTNASTLLALNIDSTNITINRKTLELITHLTAKMSAQSDPKTAPKRPKIPDKKPHETQEVSSDDLRSGRLDFILEESCLNNAKLTAKHLPSVNQIISGSASICWRYSVPRTITTLKMKPIPFMNTRDSTQEVRERLTLFLEAFDECTRSFELVKERADSLSHAPFRCHTRRLAVTRADSLSLRVLGQISLDFTETRFLIIMHRPSCR